jgi:2-dehydro-3-deoxyphosphogluconate aldolase/(4S)-4-hydroxy-2-oxoglutarate aldolase
MQDNALIENMEAWSVIAIESPSPALPLADALLEGGLPLAEIAFRTEAAKERVQKTRGDVFKGLVQL